MKVELLTFLENNEALVKSDDGRWFKLTNVYPIPMEGSESEPNLYRGEINLSFESKPCINPALDSASRKFLAALKEQKVEST